MAVVNMPHLGIRELAVAYEPPADEELDRAWKKLRPATRTWALRYMPFTELWASDYPRELEARGFVERFGSAAPLHDHKLRTTGPGRRLIERAKAVR